MEITSISNDKLLDKTTIQEIKKQSDLLLAQKDVARAWVAVRHIKGNIAGLSPDKIQPFLNDYRRIATNLKALALPLLEKQEIINLLQNNLSFLDAKYENYFISGLRAWLASQPEEDQDALLSELLKNLPAEGGFADKIRGVLDSRNKAGMGQSEGLVSGQPKPVGLVEDKDKMFAPEERQEVEDQANKLNSLGAANLDMADTEILAAKILAQSGRGGDKELFLKRAQSLIKSRLRDVRTPAEVRDYFSRAFPVGGLALAGFELEAALETVEDAYAKTHGHKAPINKFKSSLAASESPEPKEKPVDNDAVFASAPTQTDGGQKDLAVVGIQQSAAEDIFSSVAPLEPDPGLGQPEKSSPAINKRLDSAAQTKPPIAQLRGNQEIGKDQAATGGKQSVSRSRFDSRLNNKPRLDDVKHADYSVDTKTIGQADELKLMNLSDWRKIGDSNQAIEKILAKLELLAEDSLAAKLHGIRYFRDSDLFKIYLLIGQTSLIGAKKLSEVLADKSVNPEGMSEEEFFAISSLNSRLR